MKVPEIPHPGTDPCREAASVPERIRDLPMNNPADQMLGFLRSS